MKINKLIISISDVNIKLSVEIVLGKEIITW